MSERTRELEREIEELRRKVEFLERRVVATEEERGKSAAQIPVSPGLPAEDVTYARPFEVDYDPEDGEYYIFAPPGCVLVDGHEVEIADVDTESHTVSLDCLDPDDMPDALYAHVTQDASSTGGYKVEFDDEDTKEGALFNFRVCRFGSSENDGDQYDICTSCVMLGTHMLHPYEVRWAQGENGGEGAWVIWFPGTLPNNKLGPLMIGRIYIEPTGLAAAQSLPAGWYTLPNGSSDGDVWLNATVPNQDDATPEDSSACFDTQPISDSGSTSGYVTYAVLVAKVSTVAATGEKKVVQYVDSMVKLSRLTEGGGGDGGGSGSGDDGHCSCCAFSYDPETHTITDGMYLRARTWKFVQDAVVSAAGYAYLQVNMGVTGGETIVTGAANVPARTNMYTYIPLYYFNNDLEIVHDYRGAPTAQMWEF